MACPGHTGQRQDGEQSLTPEQRPPRLLPGPFSTSRGQRGALLLARRLLATCWVWLWGRGWAGGLRRGAGHCSGGLVPLASPHGADAPTVAASQPWVRQRCPDGLRALSPAQHHCSLTSVTGNRLCRPESGRQRDGERSRSDTDGDARTGRDGDDSTKAWGPPGVRIASSMSCAPRVRKSALGRWASGSWPLEGAHLP